jgi:hypothetical protein
LLTHPNRFEPGFRFHGNLLGIVYAIASHDCRNAIFEKGPVMWLHQGIENGKA